MTSYVALLRAVNVGGTGKLPNADLKEMCADAGFTNAATYIASGNVVFDWTGTAAEAQALLKARLTTYAGKPMDVMIRDAPQMALVLAANPFPDAPGNAVVAIFLDAPPDADCLAHASGVNGEILALGTQEIYVYYANGQGTSKLRIPAAAHGTARIMNTVGKLTEMVRRD